MPAQPAGALLTQAVAFTNDYIATVHARDNMFATVFTAILCPRTGRERQRGGDTGRQETPPAHQPRGHLFPPAPLK